MELAPTSLPTFAGVADPACAGLLVGAVATFRHARIDQTLRLDTARSEYVLTSTVSGIAEVNAEQLASIPGTPLHRMVRQARFAVPEKEMGVDDLQVRPHAVPGTAGEPVLSRQSWPPFSLTSASY